MPLVFSFVTKVQLARAYALGKHQHSIWGFLLEINGFRNEIAHRLKGERRDVKMAQLRAKCRAELDNEYAFLVDGASDHEVVSLACSMCLGYLGALEDDARALRGPVDSLDGNSEP